jgi:cyclopropane-fatty-acyl-phospholipid synthase
MDIETSPGLADTELDRRLLGFIMRYVGNPRVTLRLWNGEEFSVSGGNPVACIELRERRAIFDLIMSPSVGFGECYSKGLIGIHGDFLACANELARAFTRRRDRGYRWHKFRSLVSSMRGNSLSRSRHNVHHHYDLGNDFYKLWLDENMLYTCAYYDHADATLAEAQVAKLDHVCRKLKLQPGQQVIEAGCGWGGLAMHMAEHYGVSVRAYNNSRQQVEYARQQAAQRGLEDRVEFVLDDYRTIDSKCDAFVSVGMLEHVGLRNFGTLGGIVKSCLRPHGLGLIHSIGRSHSRPPDPWISKHIFPGGYIPSLGETAAIFEPYKFSVLDVENLRLHYARTCAAWLENFEAVSDTVSEMYSEEFVRTWRLYLAGSSAGFESGTLQLYQVLFAPSGNNDVPWTREYQYQSGPGTTGVGE